MAGVKSPHFKDHILVLCLITCAPTICPAASKDDPDPLLLLFPSSFSPSLHLSSSIHSSSSSPSGVILTATACLVMSSSWMWAGLSWLPSSEAPEEEGEEEEEEGSVMSEGVGTALNVTKPMRITTSETRYRAEN